MSDVFEKMSTTTGILLTDKLLLYSRLPNIDTGSHLWAIPMEDVLKRMDERYVRKGTQTVKAEEEPLPKNTKKPEMNMLVEALPELSHLKHYNELIIGGPKAGKLCRIPLWKLGYYLETWLRLRGLV